MAWETNYFDCNNSSGGYWCGDDWECSDPYRDWACYVGESKILCSVYCQGKYYTLTISSSSGGSTNPSAGTLYRPKNQNTTVTAPLSVDTILQDGVEQHPAQLIPLIFT